MRLFLLVPALALTLLPPCALALSPASIAPHRDKIKVYDGDTFSIAGERIRPVGFDAPELGRARCVAERMMGLLAKKRFSQLVHAPDLRIERIKCKNPDRPLCAGGFAHDRYRRTLARLFVGGKSVEKIMIREGYAIKYRQKFRGKWCTRF